MADTEKKGVSRIERVETAPYGTNAYIVSCLATGESVLIDAPGEADKIMGGLEGTHPICILITHRHMDHTGALQRPEAEHSASDCPRKEREGIIP